MKYSLNGKEGFWFSEIYVKVGRYYRGFSVFTEGLVGSFVRKVVLG